MGNSQSTRKPAHKPRPLSAKDIASPTPADIDIAQAIVPLPIIDIATSLDLCTDEFDLYGPTKAKVKLNVMQRLHDSPNGRYIHGMKTCTNQALSSSSLGCWSQTLKHKNKPSRCQPSSLLLAADVHCKNVLHFPSL
jgi:hypothetical protein